MPYHPAGALVAEFCSALCTAASKYLAAVFGGHSLTEAVLLGALALLRLVCSKHDWHLPELLLNITHREVVDLLSSRFLSAHKRKFIIH